MILVRNDLVEWHSDERETSPRIDRVLKVTPCGLYVWTYEVTDDLSWPELQKLEEIRTALATGDAQTLENDPFMRRLNSGEENILYRKPALRKRDELWEFIKPLVHDHGDDIFYRHKRGGLVRERATSAKCTIPTINGALRRYWKGGQTPNALLPYWDECGNRAPRDTGKKRGRHNRTMVVPAGEQAGILITKIVRLRFERAIRKHYETHDKNGKEMPFTQAFDRMLEDEFHGGWRKNANDKGKLEPILLPEHKRPTFEQFRHWYETQYNPSISRKRRVGGRHFELNDREIGQNSTEMAFGPGSVFQIDATVADIHLVHSVLRSEGKKRLIGRPVIYFVIDVFSRMIVGMSVSLEGPSWIGAMLALENMTEDKVGFCKQYGIEELIGREITAEDWPSHHLPDAILADRGEMLGPAIDRIIKAFHIDIANTAPYRADWKGIVEQNFRTIHNEYVHFAPGAVHKEYERGDPDYRLEACLTLHEFRQLMILCVLQHNQSHRLEDYELTPEMIEDGVEPYPIELWNWGVAQTNAGHLGKVDRDTVRLNLMRQQRASVTPMGIRVPKIGLTYTCKTAVEQQWFTKARKKRWHVSILYDPRKTDIVYLDHGNGKIEECRLTKRKKKTFSGWDVQEVEDYIAIKDQRRAAAGARDQQAKADWHARKQRVVAGARAFVARTVPSGESKAKQLAGARDYRHDERDAERENAYRLGDDSAPARREDATDRRDGQTEEAATGYVAPPQQVDDLRQLRREKMRQQREQKEKNDGES